MGSDVIMSGRTGRSTILQSLRVLWPAYVLIFIGIENLGDCVAHGTAWG